MKIRLAAAEKQYQAHKAQTQKRREQRRLESKEKRATAAVERKKRWSEAAEEAQVRRKTAYTKLRTGGYHITPKIRKTAGRAVRVKVKFRKKKRKKRGEQVKEKKLWGKIRKIRLT